MATSYWFAHWIAPRSGLGAAKYAAAPAVVTGWRSASARSKYPARGLPVGRSARHRDAHGTAELHREPGRQLDSNAPGTRASRSPVREDACGSGAQWSTIEVVQNENG